MANRTVIVDHNTALVDSPQFSKDWMSYQEIRHTHPDLFGLKSTGLLTLDSTLAGGVELGQYILVGGPPKAGKTTFLITFFKALAKQGVKCAWFGAEMNLFQTGTILFANISGVDRTTMRSINLQPDDWKKLERAAAEIEKYPAYWNYGFSTVEHIVKAIDDIEKQIDDPIRAIFVDYIQLMEAPGKGNRSDQIAYISRRLKALSVNRQMPTLICAAAQLRRENVRAAVYDLSAWFGSGGLERDMDIGMMIHDVPDPSNTNKMLPNYKMIEIVGSRETGDAQPVHVKYNGSMGRMTDAIEQGDRYK